MLPAAKARGGFAPADRFDAGALRQPGNPRSGGARALVDGRAFGPDRARPTQRPGLGAHSRRRRSPSRHQPTGAREAADHTQVGPPCVAKSRASIRRAERDSRPAARQDFRLAGGFRSGDGVWNAYAHPFPPAGSRLESGALALGCVVVPSGTGQTEMQVAAIADLGASAYMGTRSFLKLIAEKADELKADIGSLKKAAVSAEYLPPALRAAMGGRGIRVLQSYASADLGLIAYESEALEGMILDEGLILEIVRPGTGDTVSDGEVGEVVVTTFNPDYPLMRFGTGDLSAVLPRASPCGRTNTRIRGWMGRADQTTKVKGMFVHPSQVAEVVKRHKEILKARLVVDNPGGNDRMTLHCEVRDAPAAGLAQAIADSIREITKLRGEVAFKKPGELPNDGKVIEDAKKYE